MFIWSVQDNFAVIVFKGTGPFNIMEWLRDFKIKMIPAPNDELPGLVHEVSMLITFSIVSETRCSYACLFSCRVSTVRLASLQK